MLLKSYSNIATCDIGPVYFYSGGEEQDERCPPIQYIPCLLRS